MGAASGAWLLTFGQFLLLTKKEYMHTFFSTRTGRDWAMDFFLKSEDDAGKQNIFGCNKKQWVAIRDDVKTWVGANYGRWEEDKPTWYTEAYIAQVPPDMIPEEAQQAHSTIQASKSRSRVQPEFS